MADTPGKSKTIWFGIATVIVGALYTYLTGGTDISGAALLVMTGVAQIIQRTYTLKSEGTPPPPGPQ
jgi:membrane protein implicated in regulation of membrane protease activity